jgi:hypothetical protein
MSVRSIIHDMVIDMNETKLNAVARLRACLAGTALDINQRLL